MVVEYLHERMNEKTDLTSLPHDRLLEMVGESLDREVAPIAPFSRMGWPKGRLEQLLKDARADERGDGDGPAEDDRGKGGDER